MSKQSGLAMLERLSSDAQRYSMSERPGLGHLDANRHDANRHAMTQRASAEATQR
jgi:hypothetical protein